MLVADFVLQRLREWGVHRPDTIGQAWDEALSSNVPCVLEVVVDPEIPPVPPHLMKMQAKKAAKAMAQGDPEAFGVVEKGAKQKAHEFTESIREHLPGKND